jgi:N-acetylmuramic acid 6-phosphate etherase
MSVQPRYFLGIEGGATRTTAIVVDENLRVIQRIQEGPSNLRLSTDRQILQIWKRIKSRLDASPIAIGSFLAGCRTRQDKLRMLRLLEIVWPHSRYAVGNDTSSALVAALGDRDGIVVVCGTGSIVRARRRQNSIKVGGWGHIGGDDGSGYWMGRQLLRRIFRSYDETGSTGVLTQSVLHFLNLNTINEVVKWSIEATKFEIASLTRPLFLHYRHPLAKQIILEASLLLADQVEAAAHKAGFLRSKDQFLVAINPGLAKHQPSFFRVFKSTVRHKVPNAKVFLSETEGALGAARLAISVGRNHVSGFSPQHSIATPNPDKRGVLLKQSGLETQPQSGSLDRGFSKSTTEQRNPRTKNLDRQSISQLIQTMIREESRVLPAIRTRSKEIEKTIQWIIASFKRKGRLFYIGAGTSGRLGVLDASECPPTFGVDPEMVQGIIAGGRQALSRAIEAVEDDANYGRQTIRDRGLNEKDVLIGIAASGSTPFVLGAIEEAVQRGSKTVLLTFNPNSRFTMADPKFLKIAIPTGPEAITGSTRLKAGTATKLILNMLTTISMIRLGKVRSNLMIDLDPTNEKLHDRAARIYSILKKVSYFEARKRLEKRHWKLKELL